VGGIKRPGRKGRRLTPPSSIEVKNEWSYTSTIPYDFMLCTVKN